MPTTDFKPNVAQVGAIMRARTVDSNGAELGTFTDDTRPTADDVSGVIDTAYDLVSARLGSVPDRLEALARAVVTLRAAMLLETGYFPEDSTPDGSAFASYRDQYRDALADFDSAARSDDGASATRVASVAMGTILNPTGA